MPYIWKSMVWREQIKNNASEGSRWFMKNVFQGQLEDRYLSIFYSIFMIESEGINSKKEQPIIGIERNRELKST